MDVVYFGSGAFGVPTLRRLAVAHRVRLVVTQPDRPAGRNRRTSPTPVAEAAAESGLPVERPTDVNEPGFVRSVLDLGPSALVVIAYGQKLGPDLLHGAFAINLHASLLPSYRGAAPINRAIMAGERQTGLTVIAMTGRIDAGDILGRRVTPIGPGETAGELEARLAALGPDLVLETLAARAAGTLRPLPQDDAIASRAPKLTKEEGRVNFQRPADAVRRHVHGVTPWPGCRVRLAGHEFAILRADSVTADGRRASGSPGALLDDLTVACRPGALRLLEVQPAGGRPMTFEAWCRGHRPAPGQCVEPA